MVGFPLCPLESLSGVLHILHTLPSVLALQLLGATCQNPTLLSSFPHIRPQGVVYLHPHPQQFNMSSPAPIRYPLCPPTPHPLSPPSPAQGPAVWQPGPGPVVIRPVLGPAVHHQVLPAALALPDPESWWYGLLQGQHYKAAAALLHRNLYQ